jgi:fluoride exporter
MPELPMVSRFLWVALGGALGSVIRVALQMAMAPVSLRYPWGTWTVNVMGSFLIGCMAAWLWDQPAGSLWRLFVMAGILGGFTTFSTFSLENFNLLRGGRPLAALAYSFSSMALGMSATGLGYWLARGSEH